MTKTDKIIFWACLTVSLFLLAFSNALLKINGKKSVLIEVNGKNYASYEMEKITVPKKLEVKTEFGTNKIEISKDTVRVTDADCKDQACIGEISKQGELIVCLPNKLIIKILASGEEDLYAY